MQNWFSNPYQTRQSRMEIQLSWCFSLCQQLPLGTNTEFNVLNCLNISVSSINLWSTHISLWANTKSVHELLHWQIAEFNTYKTSWNTPHSVVSRKIFHQFKRETEVSTKNLAHPVKGHIRILDKSLFLQCGSCIPDCITAALSIRRNNMQWDWSQLTSMGVLPSSLEVGHKAQNSQPL